MSGGMKPVSFGNLIAAVSEEYRGGKTILGIPESQFFVKSGNKSMTLFGTPCAMPLGPAAGPHTQLAGNILSGYLTGGRFFELKTVQKLDNLEFDKPCIDARDECYNTEWSSELTLEQSFAEYAKAWVLLHLSEAAFGLSGGGKALSPRPASFVFNMSVGYDLEGIKTPRMDSFINGMSGTPGGFPIGPFQEEAASAIAEDGGSLFSAAAVEGIPDRICNSVTLSTMHGCPPGEIEAICSYLLEEKKLNTFVKLNPTLLGFSTVKEILGAQGWTDIQLKESTFTHDLQYAPAKKMFRKLREKAAGLGLEFGVKLTNTLPVVNTGSVLPGEEMYMSGRALYPVSITLAARLAADFSGNLPISFCAGITGRNAPQVLASGIRPLTVAAELLKPGGYYRLADAAERLDRMEAWPENGIDADKVAELADKAVSGGHGKKSWRGFGEVRIPRPLPLFDCFAAPCVEACPIRQNVPAYIRTAGRGRCSEALEIIMETNPLPAITGSICDHQCMYACTRIDYDGAVRIREMKRTAEEFSDRREIEKRSAPAVSEDKPKTAVVGAGPAGLSAAYFLVRAGFPVTVFDKEETAGGIVSTVLPRFRISEEAVHRDIEYIRSAGVEFRFGAEPRLNAAALKQEGFGIICVAVGAGKGAELDLPGGNPNILQALEFLKSYNRAAVDLGSRVVVVGGGNTAMDSARAAGKTPGVKEVTVLYRRSENEMPADREEYDEAAAEGVRFVFLRAPVRYANDGTLTAEIMELGNPDRTGRRKPLPTGGTDAFEADSVITAVGEKPDPEILARFGIEPSPDGRATADPETLETGRNGVYLLGDARTGPSTVVECIAEGRKAADAIIRRYGKEQYGKSRESRNGEIGQPELREILARRRGAEADGNSRKEIAAEAEARRCLECGIFCGKCVEVCPNRANIAVFVPGFRDGYQIVHLDGYCNECGNCAVFCPWEGKPYTDKFTIFSAAKDYTNSTSIGAAVIEGAVSVRLEGGEYRWTPDRPFPDPAVEKLLKVLSDTYPSVFSPAAEKEIP